MKASYLLTVLLTAAVLLATIVTLTPAAPSAAFSKPVRNQSSHPNDTPSPTPGCDGWSEAAAYPIAVYGNAAVGLGSYLYSFGGIVTTDTQTVISNAYKYDGSSWTQIASLPVADSFLGAVTDGTYIYLVNGHTNNYLANGHSKDGEVAVLYRYDPVTDSYTELAAPTLATAAHPSVYLDGYIYRIGGVTEALTITNTVEAYDIGTNSWASRAPYPLRAEDIAATSINGYIYAAGGDMGTAYALNKTYRYDPASDTWEDSAISDLPYMVGDGAAGVLNGNFLMTGAGADGKGTIEWLPASNSWSAIANMIHPAFAPGSATLGNAFYSIAGDDGGNHSNNNQRYTNTCLPPTPQPTATLCATPFADISGNMFYSSIAYLYCNGAVSGTDATHYSPAATSTRGQFARVVIKGFGLPITTPGSQSFTDVPPSYFAYNYIESGLAYGILSGYAADQCAAAGATYPCYLPNKAITRAELTKLVVKAAGYPRITPGNPTFVDVPASYFAYSYIETAYAHNVIRGTDATHFQPGRNIRRDEMAQVVYKGISTP